MFRLLLVCCLALPLLAGCGSRPSGSVPSIAPMTPEETTAWLKYRRDYQEARWVVAMRSTDGLWYMSDFYSRSNLSDTFNGRTDKQERAIEDAQQTAASPNWSAAVLVDLAAGDSPAGVRWFTDDGKGVKESTTAPSPELARALTSYLLKVQKGCSNFPRAGSGY